MRSNALERLKLKIPEITDNAQDERLLAYLEDAQEDVLGYCRRTVCPTVLYGLVERIALMYYNKEGVEGESSHSEGGISRSYEGLSKDDQKLLDSQRLAKQANFI